MQSLNADSPINWTKWGISRFLSFEQPSNDNDLIKVKDCGSTMIVNYEQLVNVDSLISVNGEFITIRSREEQSWKANSPIDVTDS